MKWLVNLVRIAVIVGVSKLALANPVILEPTPDLMATFLNVLYNASTASLTADGSADSITVLQNGVPTLHGISSGTFSLTAHILGTGIATSGTLAINGCIPDLPGAPGCASSSLLLSGDLLLSFDFVPIPDGELTFGFARLVGDFQPLYANVAFVKMNLIGFPGDFISDFSTSDFSNVADVGVVPEPGTWLLFASGVALCCCFGRRSRAPKLAYAAHFIRRTSGNRPATL